MPAFATHYIFASELMNELRELSPIELDEQAVLIGSQGPDIFFFHRVFPWMPGKSLRKIGSSLHRSKPSEIFDAMLEYSRSCDNKSLAVSYLFGFVMHYALDRKCHPYVYALQDKMVETPLYRNAHTAHNVIEFSMDAYLISRRLGIKNPESFVTAKTIELTDEQCSELSNLLRYVTKRVLGIELNANISKAFYDTKAVQKITHDTKGIKRTLVGLLDIPVSIVAGGYKFSAMLRPKDLEKAKKYGNIFNGKWKSPFDDNVRTESFEELFELAKAEALDMLAGVIDGKSTIEITNNLSFLTGVEVK